MDGSWRREIDRWSEMARRCGEFRLTPRGHGQRAARSVETTVFTRAKLTPVHETHSNFCLDFTGVKVTQKYLTHSCIRCTPYFWCSFWDKKVRPVHGWIRQHIKSKITVATLVLRPCLLSCDGVLTHSLLVGPEVSNTHGQRKIIFKKIPERNSICLLCK